MTLNIMDQYEFSFYSKINKCNKSLMFLLGDSLEVDAKFSSCLIRLTKF